MADTVHSALGMSTAFSLNAASPPQPSSQMAWSLFDGHGRRKYLTHAERLTFIRAALCAEEEIGSFCLTMALTGARISEVLALTPARIDGGNDAIVFETLKRRQRGIFRAVPVPRELIDRLEKVRVSSRRLSDPDLPTQRLWEWSRTTAWKRVKAVMRAAGIPEAISKPRALRHTLGVEAVRNRIALSLVKKWLGHAKIETTAIYADPIGFEERELARLMWTDCLRD